MAITRHEAVIALNGSEYREEHKAGVFGQMREAGLVAVFGASDDLVEFRGAIDDELGDAQVYVTRSGLLENQCESEYCPHYHKQAEGAASITPLWCPNDEVSWAYKTDIPHETFSVFDEGEHYCEGIVFALADVPETGGA